MPSVNGFLKHQRTASDKSFGENQRPDGRLANEAKRPQQSAGKGTLREVYRLTC